VSRRSDLTASQARATQAYITQLRDLMGLHHWEVYLAADAAPKDANASIHPVDGRYVAPLFVSRHWWKRSADDKRNDIVHELLHLTHRAQTDVVRTGVINPGVLPARSRLVVWALFSEETERMVDHLAGVLAPLMPEFPGP
jgi:hypothetical protein